MFKRVFKHGIMVSTGCSRFDQKISEKPPIGQDLLEQVSLFTSTYCACFARRQFYQGKGPSRGPGIIMEL